MMSAPRCANAANAFSVSKPHSPILFARDVGHGAPALCTATCASNGIWPRNEAGAADDEAAAAMAAF